MSRSFGQRDIGSVTSSGEVILRTQEELEGSLCLPVDVPLPQRRPAMQQVARWLLADGWPVVVYGGSRLVLLLLAWFDALITHRPLASELSLYDGQWYLKVARFGYPVHALHVKSTLGFLPLYPALVRGLAALADSPPLAAGLVIAISGGLVAAALVRRIATLWWGERTGRWAVVVFCLFPGSVVFSMVYSECLTVPLVLGCLLALRSGRWALAGVLAGLASAVEPVALMLVPVCLVAALREIRLAGWRDRAARRSLMAPLLAPTGLGAFAVFLWYWTGTPLASYMAQHYGWHQGDPLTLLRKPIVERMLDHPGLLDSHLLNLSLWNGVLGTVFLVFALVALVHRREELTTGALLWTCGIGGIALWSVMTPANARMLIIAFPAVIIWARCLRGRQLAIFVGAEAVLFVLTSGLTFAGLMLP